MFAYRKKYLKIVLLCLLVQGFHTQEDVLCTDLYCEKYLTQNDCSSLPDATNREVIHLDSPTPCNCCEYYLLKLGLDEVCLIGSPGSLAPESVCGDGLFCKESSAQPSCMPIKEKCTKEQDLWENLRKNGELGNKGMKPKCDRKGLFHPVKCIPGQTCYCLSEDGERIFGETPFVSHIDLLMKCDCARKFHKASTIFSKSGFKVSFLRCLPNGNYDPIQCLGNDCICVDTFTGIPSTQDWFKKPVNISDIDEETMEFCFDKEIHQRGKYLRECELKYQQVKEEMVEFQEEGINILGTSLPRCQPDGYYDKLQETYTEKYCADVEGNQIENYILPINSDLSKSMNCNCARARHTLQKNNYIELPECCANGNYAQLQCIRNECRCVDIDGNQIGVQVYKEHKQDLTCYDENEILCAVDA